LYAVAAELQNDRGRDGQICVRFAEKGPFSFLAPADTPATGLDMTLLYYDPRFLDHNTGDHPECPERLRQIMAQLDERGLTDRCTRPTWQEAQRDRLTSIHDPALVEGLQQLAADGGGRADADTVVSPPSVDVAKLAAGAVCDAVDRVIADESRSALCLVRPPGHHALPQQAMGFCLFNNIALGAQAALDRGVSRVLIVDWDVHHGNGTQACFYDDPRVGFFSVHRWPFYPGTGEADETGTSDGLGTTRNLPLPFGISRKDYLAAVAGELEDFAVRIKPELVLVSAGFDSHHADPVGSLGLEVEDFSTLSTLANEIADTHAAGRIVSVLEGGYNPPVLAECVAVHLEHLLSGS
jgi:acetoin utilization deacetylase AcuC-like enzyme